MEMYRSVRSASKVLLVGVALVERVWSPVASRQLFSLQQTSILQVASQTHAYWCCERHSESRDGTKSRRRNRNMGTPPTNTGTAVCRVFVKYIIGPELTGMCARPKTTAWSGQRQ